MGSFKAGRLFAGSYPHGSLKAGSELNCLFSLGEKPNRSSGLQIRKFSLSRIKNPYVFLHSDDTCLASNKKSE